MNKVKLFQAYGNGIFVDPIRERVVAEVNEFAKTHEVLQTNFETHPEAIYCYVLYREKEVING